MNINRVTHTFKTFAGFELPSDYSDCVFFKYHHNIPFITQAMYFPKDQLFILTMYYIM